MANPKQTKAVSPTRLETLKDYAQKIFEPIRRGENVTTIWVAMAGRRIRNKFIISYPKLFEAEIGDINKYLLVYVEPLELTEESDVGYIKLLTTSIIETYNNQKANKTNKLPVENYTQVSLAYPQALDSLRRLIEKITSQNLEIVLFLGEFDELAFADQILYNNLKSLWTKFENKLYFVFLVLEDIIKPEAVRKYGELNELLLKNVIYVPLGDENDINYLIDYFGRQNQRKFSKEEKSLLLEICGGHPYLIKSCSRLISLMNGEKIKIPELKENLLSHFEPRSACQKIFDYRSPAEKNFLRELLKDEKIQKIPEEAGTLTKLRLIKKSKTGSSIPFGDLFKSIIEKGKEGLMSPQTVEAKLAFDKQSGAILINGKGFEEKFTRQEYEILHFFLEEPNRLRTRDEISEAMWGKESYDQYSDWAIDQVISKIRKKLKTLGIDNSLVTVRGRGYKLVLD